MVEIKENIQCFQYMFFYIFLIFSFVFMRLIRKNLPNEDDKKFLIKAMDYWKKKPIWKMEARNIDSEEIRNMSKYSLGIWPGVKNGCNCSYGYYNYRKGSCSKKNITNNCINVKEQDPTKIYNYYFKYYVTYYDSDYLSLLSRIENLFQCKKGYKKCGILDNTRIRPFCVKENEECIINYFNFETEEGLFKLKWGFNESKTSNRVINNLFLKDIYGCILNEDYLTDDFILFKNKTDKLVKCNPEKSTDIFQLIPNSDLTKEFLYTTNNIYKGYEIMPSKYSRVYIYSMTYYGLNISMNKYYYSDVSVFKNLKLFNYLIFIFLKVVIQLVYIIFMQKANFKKKEREIIYNGIWACVFLTYLILIWLFNNSVYRTSQLISSESDDKLFKAMKRIRIMDILLALIILSTQIIKIIYIITNKSKKKYSEFINPDK